MKRELLLSIAISLTFLTAGFLLLHYDLVGYGLSFFVFLPFILGYILASSTIRSISLVGLVISIVIFFILLFTGGLEGMVCILMALPLVIAAIALGTLVKYFVVKKQKQDEQNNMITKALLPFSLFLCLGFIEAEMTKRIKDVISVKTEIIFPYSTIEVYDAIKSVDTLYAEKPFLMKLDLPIPQKCVLEKEEVGGLRTCYFDGGSITERITQLEKGKVLRMDVIDCKLTGRKWLGFQEAIYSFDPVGRDSCKLTRITTYTSVLTPRWYWQPLEEIGIGQEHDYVFASLRNNLIKRYGR